MKSMKINIDIFGTKYTIILKANIKNVELKYILL